MEFFEEMHSGFCRWRCSMCLRVCAVLARRPAQKWLCSTDQLHREVRMNHRIPPGKAWGLNLSVISWASKGGRQQGRAWGIQSLLHTQGETSPATLHHPEAPNPSRTPTPGNSIYLAVVRNTVLSKNRSAAGMEVRAGPGIWFLWNKTSGRTVRIPPSVLVSNAQTTLPSFSFKLQHHFQINEHF